ncbi:FAD/NAD(P)-binding domain-containing protein [Fistulina hepatica ATCC 64428]|uniref:FAD/NAD(P)-binding domain-containing protein n=1 Tax=Fistulina hepatica ATCC 64428 TaxID=1128425 RepID=A0A0D7AFI5_9AGAR|nr:FAD/NAD(P)-binding domain-containing protein [Fistulina hepatica ATCC 64428]
MSSPKNIAIVGAGAGGVLANALSKSLDPSLYTITLIDPRPYHVLLPATARLVVSDEDHLEDQAFVPLDKIFANGNGRLIEGKVSKIDAYEKSGTLTLGSGDTIDYDILVLASGSKWHGPIALPENDDDMPAYLAKTREEIKNAKSIVLVGGGAVGIETAGEIKDVYPDKKVTVVHGDDMLLNKTYPARFRKAFESRFRATGVNVVFNEYIDEIPTGSYTSVRARSGKEIPCNLALSTRGPTPATDYVPSSFLAENKRVKVQPTLQTVSHANIFAVGDIIDIDEQKQLAKVKAQIQVVASNISALANGGKMKSYNGSSELICVTFGRSGGVTYLGILWGIVLGDWFTAMAKSKSLMLPMMRGAYGY